MFKMLLILLITASCGQFLPKKETSTEPELIDRLNQRADEYRNLLPSVQDEHGFVDTDRCDSLLFSGLLSAAGAEVDIKAAEEKPGRWLRRPVTYPECWKNKESRSTISRDMLLGVMWHTWVHKDLTIAEKLWEYGTDRDWFMGDDDIRGGHTYFTPSFRTTLAQIIFKLDGEDHNGYRNLPSLWDKSCSGFECHLRAVHIALRADIANGIQDNELKIIQSMHTKNPNNPLFATIVAKYTDGNYEKSLKILLNEQKYPAGRLPTSDDICESWPAQRADNDSGLDPCPTESRTHSGGDLLFVHFLMER